MLEIEKSKFSEFDEIQNPGLGAAMLWKFSQGFSEVDSKFPNILHAFIVLPLLMHSYSYEILSSTHEKSGLNAIVLKLVSPPENKRKTKIGNIVLERGAEDLYSLNSRIIKFRKLTMQSLLIANDTGLIDLNSATGDIKANNVLIPKWTPLGIEKILSTSFKFGKMCNLYDLSRLSCLLQVKF